MGSRKFTDELRDKMRAHLGLCPTCGHPRMDTLRGLAQKSSISPPTLTRWLNQGRDPDARTINRAVAFLALPPAASKRKNGGRK